MNMQNRRAVPRVGLVADVWLGEDGVFTRGRERLTNLSVGGAFIEATGGFAVGSVVSLRFSLGRDYITSTSIVRYVGPYRGIGVEFIDISPENKQRLASFIDART